MAQNRLYATLVTLIGILFLFAASATPVGAGCHLDCTPHVHEDMDVVTDEVDDTATAVFTIYADTYKDLFGDKN